MRALLLTEDREEFLKLQRVLENRIELAEKVSPIISEHLESFKHQFPHQYSKVVNKLIEDKLQNSKDEILELIYPMLGSMIKKYIQQQFDLLKESIEMRLQSAKKKLNPWTRIKNKFARISDVENALIAGQKPILQEIFLVERHSGIIIAHASQRPNLDADAIAGMFTAIKSFVEDAFKISNQELDLIQYDNYKLMVENYNSYYIACLIEGSMSVAEKINISQQLRQYILDNYAEITKRHDDYTLRESLSLSLQQKLLLQ